MRLYDVLHGPSELHKKRRKEIIDLFCLLLLFYLLFTLYNIIIVETSVRVRLHAILWFSMIFSVITLIVLYIFYLYVRYLYIIIRYRSKQRYIGFTRFASTAKISPYTMLNYNLQETYATLCHVTYIINTRRSNFPTDSCNYQCYLWEGRSVDWFVCIFIKPYPTRSVYFHWKL